MLKIEYEIKLNERGRPCIDLPPKYEQNPEDKFFALEIARYYLQTVFNGMGERYDQHTKDIMDMSIRFLGQIGDEMAELIYNDMISMGDVAVIMGEIYNIQVKSIEERDAIPEKGFFHHGKIFNRQEGLRVNVQTYDPETYMPNYKIYELHGGISNDKWIEIANMDNDNLMKIS